MSTEETTTEKFVEVELVAHFADLTKAAEEQAAPVIMISRQLARGILNYIDKLEEELEEEEVDNVSDLKVGDTVKTLIEYMFTSKGAQGIVDRIEQGEYPIRVRFVGEKYPIGYDRYELGKVT